MTKLYNNLIKNILIFALFASPLMLTAGEAEQRAANELLDTARFEKVMDGSINAAVQMLKQMDPKMDNHEATVRKFYNEHIAESFRKDVVDMYAEIFTEKELKDITAFHKTRTGQKALEMMPEIMQRSMQIAQTRLMQNMGEL